MGWIKLDDAFLDHPKFLAVGPLAGYLCICGIAWSNRNLMDGYIPRTQVPRLVNFDGFAHHMWMGDLAGGGDDVDPLVLASELVEAGLWDEVTGGFVIHDYHDWQKSSDQIIAARDDARARQRKSRKQRASHGESQRDDDVSHGNVTDPVTDESQAGHVPEEGRRKKEEPSTSTPQSSSLDESRTARELFGYWQQQCGHPQAKPTRDRLAKVRARLREGYTADQIRQAIDGAARAAYVSPDGKKYDDLELICRSGSKLEGFIDRPGAAGQNGSRNGRAELDALAAHAAKVRAEMEANS